MSRLGGGAESVGKGWGGVCSSDGGESLGGMGESVGVNQWGVNQWGGGGEGEDQSMGWGFSAIHR